MATIYESVLFLQGTDAETYLSIIDTYGPEEGLRHLSFFYDLEDRKGTVCHESPVGENDQQAVIDDKWLVNWNLAVRYVGVCHIREE